MRSHTTGKMIKSDIDFVVLWVDPNDPKWQHKKLDYTPDAKSDVGVNRYRDWGILKYWFRSVEKYAPWVRKIHFVTDEQIPEWLNLDNTKLCHVNHYDYIDKSALPVFNSSAIEIGIHNIPGLSEKFVFFNDDMFITDYITPDYYFTNGVPNDMAGLTRKCVASDKSVFSHILVNDYNLLNKHFNKKDVIKQNRRKWFNLGYGKTLLRTLLNSNRETFDGLVIPHLSVPYLKKDFEKVWEKERDVLLQTQHHKFRDVTDVNHFVFRYWRMCDGAFFPRKSSGKYVPLNDLKSINIAANIIRRRTYPEVCLNDLWGDSDFEQARNMLDDAFRRVLPEKSNFEK